MRKWESKGSYVCWLTSQMATMAGVGTGESQDPVTPSRSPVRLAEKPWAVTCCFTRYVIRKVDCMWSSWDSNKHSDMGY